MTNPETSDMRWIR